jgi:hypothetical protein
LLIDFNSATAERIGFAALAILLNDDGARHTGVIYRDDFGNILLLHLAWNYALRNDALSTKYRWVETILPQREQKYIAGLCTLIAANNPEIPYGLDAAGFSFDPSNGKMTPGPQGKGFTCATFVLAIFESAGHVILLQDEWPDDANQDWQLWVIDTLRKTGAPEDQIAAVERDVGCKRFSPEEVVASSTLDPWPISFCGAQTASLALLSQLRAA